MAIALRPKAREHGAQSGREGSFVARWFLLAALCALPLRAQTGGDLELPALVEWKAADYPEQALQRGIEADVPCEVDVSPKGEVARVLCDVDEESGFSRGARGALFEAVFRPARLHGQPAPARI